MAGIASPARDIPSTTGRDNLAAVSARNGPLAKVHPLPTPPNSISPALIPHGLRAYGAHSATAAASATNAEIDSDLDLQEGTDQAEDVASSLLGATGAITPALLAKHHLPGILLAHGPLAIRHITGYLTTSVPGFSGVAPAKARRLVVGALEGRGVGDQEGTHGEVQFEKVGWGRWSTKIVRPIRGNSPPPSGPSSFAFGVPVSTTPDWAFDRTRLSAPTSSWAGNSVTFSHDDDDVDMLEDEADKMSMDGSCSSSEAPPEEEIMVDDPADLTDEEDWAAIGAAGLRAASGSAVSGHHTSTRPTGGCGGGGPYLMARSVPLPDLSPQQIQLHNSNFSASNAQERDAVEALIQLGSVE